jgi:anti-sigma regulatory factor (Ser/Thr protein kinase)
MQLIAFPSQCDNNIESYKTTLVHYQKAKLALHDEIIFDCGNVQFFRPRGLNLVACFISEILSKEYCPEIFFTPPKKQIVFDYIKNQGFFDCFQFESEAVQQKISSRIQHETYSTRIRLKKLENLNYSYIAGVAEWLSENCSMDSATAFSIFNVTLVEVINNVVQHSQSPIGCFVCAQAYFKEDRLILSIVDLGKGFLESLSESYPQLRSNSEAIELAIKEGITSKGMRNAGRGLWILSDFLKECSGKLNIVSGDGFLTQDIKGSITTKHLSFDLGGSCINIDINNLSGLASRF